MSSDKPVLVSGIKPTGDLHIGNYFGAMRQLVELSKTGKYRPFIFVADYHALNTMQDAQEMRRRTRELVRGLRQEIPAGWDIVIHPKSTLARADFAALQSELLRVLRDATKPPQ